LLFEPQEMIKTAINKKPAQRDEERIFIALIPFLKFFCFFGPTKQTATLKLFT